MTHDDRRPPNEHHLSVGVDDRASGIVRAEARRFFVFDDDEVASELLTALSEIVQNAVEAHRGAGIGTEVEITFTAAPPSVRVVDVAGGFDWEAGNDAVPAPDSVTGRGLRIAEAFVPDLTITSGAEGTTVVLPFHRSAAAGG